MMKKLKRRLSKAFKGSSPNIADLSGSNSLFLHQNGGVRLIGANPVNSRSISGYQSTHMRAWHLSNSMSRLGERLALDGVILEEGYVDYNPDGSSNHDSCYNSSSTINYEPVKMPKKKGRPVSMHALHCGSQMPLMDSTMTLQTRSRQYENKKEARNRYSWHASRFLGSQNHLGPAVVHETCALGSDGESLEVSPCTSDQMSTSSCYPSGSEERYIPNVKLRQKPTRLWSEQDIQKRLSLPADIRLPQGVIDKLNRTPTLDNPLTRKSRRASLSEIGFGKLETYKKIFDLGEGTYATVWLGKSLLTGKSVAMKEMRLEHEEGAPCTAIREVSLLRSLKHANVVTLHDIIYTDRVLTLVFEFVERDLREYMEEIARLISIDNIKLFLVQLLRGLAYCHRRRILHRDLKPQNLLINRLGELKLADFGLARAQSIPTKTYSNEVVTLWYRPPDVLLGSTDYTTHIDMWGVGCIFYEMLHHKPMFPGQSNEEQLKLIFNMLGTPTMEECPDLRQMSGFKQGNYKKQRAKSLIRQPRVDPQRADLLEKCLKYDGKKRISALDAMHHPFLDCFPPAIFSLSDTESVLSLPGVKYIPDPIALKTTPQRLPS